MSRLFGLGAAAVVLLAGACAPAQAGFVNGGFEDPSISPDTVSQVSSVPGWSTTASDGIQIRRNGLAFSGAQYAAFYEIDSVIFQDATGVVAGSQLNFTFAHRGNLGPDTIRLTIIDLGADNALGGGDDTQLFSQDYTAASGVWDVRTSSTPISALGNTIRFAFTSTEVNDGGENNTVGNFLDAADFTAGTPVPAPAGLVLVLTGALPACFVRMLRRRSGR